MISVVKISPVETGTTCVVTCVVRGAAVLKGVAVVAGAAVLEGMTVVAGATHLVQTVEMEVIMTVETDVVVCV